VKNWVESRFLRTNMLKVLSVGIVFPFAGRESSVYVCAKTITDNFGSPASQA
jgi:hypothetical protein